MASNNKSVTLNNVEAIFCNMIILNIRAKFKFYEFRLFSGLPSRLPHIPPPVTSSAMSLQHVIADLRDSIRFFTNKLNVTSTHTIFAYSGIVKVKTISDCDL